MMVVPVRNPSVARKDASLSDGVRMSRTESEIQPYLEIRDCLSQEDDWPLVERHRAEGAENWH